MPLSKVQRKRLRDKGFSAKDIADVETELVEDEAADEGEDTGRRSKPKASGSHRVAILEGEAAQTFLDRWMGGSKDDDTGAPKGRRSKAADEDDDDDDADDDDDEDAEAKVANRWFGT